MNANEKYVCPRDNHVCEDVTSLFNHFLEVHPRYYEEDVLPVLRGCVFPGPVPTEEQIVAVRKRFVPDTESSLVGETRELLAGIRMTPCNEIDAEALVVRFWGCSDSAAKAYISELRSHSSVMLVGRVPKPKPGSQWTSKITDFLFEEGKPPTAVVHMNVFFELIMHFPRFYTLNVGYSEERHRINVDNLVFWLKFEQELASRRSAEPGTVIDISCCDEAKQQQKEAVREDQHENNNEDVLQATLMPDTESMCSFYSAKELLNMDLASPVAKMDRSDWKCKIVCPFNCAGEIYGSLKLLRNHLSTVHREDYLAARKLLCTQVIPGPIPTDKQLIEWRRHPLIVRDDMVMFDVSMFAGIRVAPRGGVDIHASIMRFTGCSTVLANDYVARICHKRVQFHGEHSGWQSSACGLLEIGSKIRYVEFTEYDNRQQEKTVHVAVAPMHIILRILMFSTGFADAIDGIPADWAGEIYIHGKINDWYMRLAMEQDDSTHRDVVSGNVYVRTDLRDMFPERFPKPKQIAKPIARSVEPATVPEIPRSEDAKQEQKEAVREDKNDDEDWLHAAPGEKAESLAAVFKGFSVLDVLAQAKLLCLIYKGVNRAGFADALCVEIDAMRAREAIAQELTKQATEKTKQELLPERLKETGETATKKRRRQRKKNQEGKKKKHRLE